MKLMKNIWSCSARIQPLYPTIRLSHPFGWHVRCKNGVFRGEAVELHRGYRPHGDDRMVPRLAWVCLGARICFTIFTQHLGKIIKDSSSLAGHGNAWRTVSYCILLRSVLPMTCSKEAMPRSSLDMPWGLECSWMWLDMSPAKAQIHVRRDALHLQSLAVLITVLRKFMLELSRKW